MLKTKIDTNFPGVNTNSINWMKHYLNGGDDVGAAWNGIADSVSGYTYKYSNQFEFDTSFSRLIQPGNMFVSCALPPKFADADMTNSNYLGQSNVTFETPLFYKQTPTKLNVSFIRLPYPDLPGVLVVDGEVTAQWPDLYTNLTSAGGVVDCATPVATKTFPGYCIPILDPNWEPDTVSLETAESSNYAFVDNPPGSWVQINNAIRPNDFYTIPRTRGMSENLSAWRLAGASATLTIPVSEYYKNGTIVACTTTTAVKLGGQGGTVIPPYKAVDHMQTIIFEDLPTSYSDVTSVKNYHKFSASEGCYIVLHNSQPTYDFYNYEGSYVNMSRSYGHNITFPGQTIKMSWVATYVNSPNAFYGIKIVHGDSVVEYPFAFSKDYATLAPFYKTKILPVFNIPDTTRSEWNLGTIATAINDQDKALLFSFKLNTYAECYISASSALKPSVSVTSPYYPRLLEYLSEFYHEHDGIYPASWNDGKKVWNMFKRFLGSDMLAKTVSMVSPSAGQIVSLVQSEVQRLANKKGQKDSKLSKTEKEQVKSIVNTMKKSK